MVSKNKLTKKESKLHSDVNKVLIIFGLIGLIVLGFKMGQDSVYTYEWSNNNLKEELAQCKLDIIYTEHTKLYCDYLVLNNTFEHHKELIRTIDCFRQGRCH